MTDHRDRVRDITAVAVAWLMSGILRQPIEHDDIPAKIMGYMPLAVDWLAWGWVGFLTILMLIGLVVSRRRG